jgi:hypothetical protein
MIARERPAGGGRSPRSGGPRQSRSEPSDAQRVQTEASAGHDDGSEVAEAQSESTSSGSTSAGGEGAKRRRRRRRSSARAGSTAGAETAITVAGAEPAADAPSKSEPKP